MTLGSVAPLATVLVISFSDLASDPRVDRQIAALLTQHRVIAAGLAPSEREGVEFVHITDPRLGLLDGVTGVARLAAQRFDVAYWRHPRHRDAYERISGVRADVIIANDAAALPIAARLGPPVVFDAHEYAPEQFADNWWWRRLVAPYVRWQCQTHIPHIAAMTSVSPTIADQYEREFSVPAAVVTNAPPFADLQPTPVGDPVRILHHGGALRDRHPEEMLRLVELLEERFVLDLMLVEGTPGLRDRLIHQARGDPRIRFPSPVPMQHLVSVANAYDIGLYSLPPNNFNRRYALPNKLFEFIQARLAVAIGPSPEMAALVRRYGCGVVASDFRPETLAEELNALDADTIAGFKRASDAAAPELCAERNAEIILNTVDVALRSAPR